MLNSLNETNLKIHCDSVVGLDLGTTTEFSIKSLYVTCSDKISVNLQISSPEIKVLLERAEKELCNGV